MYNHSTETQSRLPILVTGGAGYIGSHVVRALDRAGFFPIVYDSMLNGHAFALGWGSFEHGDVRDEAALRKVFEKWRPAAVMHFAALINVGDSVNIPDVYHDNNVGGSRCLLNVMRAFDVRRLVFSSTAAVYGNPSRSTPAIPETSALQPVNPYGDGKLEIEKAIASACENGELEAVVFRYFNAAGASLDARLGEAHVPETHLIPIVLERAAGLRADLVLNGNDYATRDGTCVRDYVHVEDLADAHLRGLARLFRTRAETRDSTPAETRDTVRGEVRAGTYEVFNLGSEAGFTNLEVVRAAERVCDRPIPFTWGPRRAGDPASLIADASLAKRVLGWSPEHSDLETIVRTAWQWLRRRDRLTAPGKAATSLESVESADL